MKIQNRYEYDPNKDLLGRGGFARVYRATDTLLHRDVALKVFSNTAGHRYSVLDEIRKAIGLEHPNLLRYYDVILLEVENGLGEKDQTQIGVMELANAGDLKDFARANPGSPVLYKLLKEVLQGLEYLHGKGIIHRDLKAQNILLVKQNGQLTAKISDFGISKDMGSGGHSSSMMVGTVEYMAPEQFAPGKYGIDGKISSNLDLWSFGIMVHELLTDTTPFGSRDGDTTAEQIMAQILSTELPQDIDRLPEPYQSVIRKCLVANARERIRKASELIGYFDGSANAARVPMPDDATRIYPKGGPTAQPVTNQEDDATKVYPKASEPRAQGRKGILAAAVAALVLAVGAGGWVVNERQVKEATQAQATTEAKVAADAKLLADTKAAADAKVVADAKAAADAKVVADTKAAADAKVVADAKPAAHAKAAADAMAAADAKALAEVKAPSASERFKAGPGGTLIDSKTGLQWTQTGNGSRIDWNDATRYCQGKGSGWGLPTLEQLEGIVDETQGQTCGVDNCFVSLKFRLTVNLYWSNERKGSSEAFIGYLSGRGELPMPVEGRYAQALCVRRP